MPLELAFIDSLPSGPEPAPVAAVAQPVPQAAAPAAAQPAVQQQVAPQPIAAQTEAPESKPDKPQVTRKSVPAPKVEAAEVAPDTRGDAPSFEIGEFKGKKWREFSAQAGQKNRNYKTWLSSAQPLAFEGNTLVLGFDLDFLLKKLESEAQEVSKILSQVMGAKCHIRCVLNNEYQSPTAGQGKNFNEQLQDIANEVGGVVRDS